MSENKREAFRVTYQAGRGPEFIFGLRRFAVTDLSETGCRLHVLKANDEVGAAMAGTLLFRNKKKLEVLGVVIRNTGTFIALKFTKSIPARIILEEQRAQKD